jgi:hypothetical protein
MSNESVSQPAESNRLVSDGLHPLVYKAMVGLALWLVLSVWGFFTDRGYIVLSLSVVTWLVGVAVVLSSTLARIGRNNRGWGGRRRLSAPSPFHDWARGDFELSDERIKGSVVAIEIFVPLAAVAIGMTLFAIVRDVVVS